MNESAPVHTLQSASPSFDYMLSNTSAAIYATDPAGIITYFNDAAANLWGLSPVIGDTRWCGSWKIYDTGGKPLPHELCPMAVCLKEKREVAGQEIIVERPDGTKSQILVNPRPIVSADGSLIGAVNTLIDVTAARNAERGWKRSESFAKHVLDSSPDCIKVLNLEGQLQSINACGCVSLEIEDPGQAVGLSYFDFWHGDEKEAALAAAKRALSEGSGRFTGSYTSRSGKVTFWDEIITALPDEYGRPSGFVVVSRDMTEHHFATLAMSRRLTQQSALATIGALALSEPDFGTLLNKIVPVLADAVGCSLAKVLEFADQADHLVLRAGVGWKEGLVGKASVGLERSSQAGYTLLAGTPIVVEDLATEKRFDGPPLLREHHVRSGMSVTIPGSKDRPYGVLGVHSQQLLKFHQPDVDFLTGVANVIAARWRQEEALQRQTLLMREMSHRTGNLLQLAHSVFLQTLRFTHDLEQAKTTYGQRLAAMARTNIMVSQGGWGKTSVLSLADEVLEPFRAKIRFSGRDLILPAEVCFDLGMIWHELSTNSAKYGALGRTDGIVELSWSLRTAADGTKWLTLIWQDTSGGLPANRKGSGFGMKLISQLVERKHAGKIEIEHEPTYKCAIEMKINTGNEEL